MKNRIALLPLLSVCLVLLFGLSLVYGAVSIPLREVIDILCGKGSSSPAWEHIVWQARLPQAVTALFAGASLAVSGLLLQTLFRNPLAGPSILGISDGANLGVAAVLLYWGGSISQVSDFPITGYVAVILAALLGAFAILGIIGYMVSSLISILNYYAAADRVHAFVMWGLGNFSAVSMEQLPFFSIVSVTGLLLSVLLIKPLNALLLGEMYAANLGVKVKQARMQILFCTGLLTAIVTAFCGPISFIGLAVPHIARLLLGTSNHKLLVPATILAGSCVALLCNLLMVVPGSNTILPLNAVTPMLGAPVIIYVIINRKNIQYFN